jgi:hypothetical protein
VANKITVNTIGLDKLRAMLKRLNKLALTIGFQDKWGRQRYKTGINVASVALFNEFGTAGFAGGVTSNPSGGFTLRQNRGANKGIPARNFLRATFFENRATLPGIIAREFSKSLAGTLGPIEMLGGLGEILAQMVKRKIDTSKSWAVPNAPSTIAKKGFDYPLHETGLMSKSVSWAVRKNSARGSIITLGVAI